VQRDREAAREAAIAGAVAARAEALLEGTASDVAVVPRPASSADDGLSHEIATARMVEERLAAKLREAEAAVRRAEGRVRDAAMRLLVEHGERLAGELEGAEAEARAKRASLSALAHLWTETGGRVQPIQVGRKCHWVLNNDPNIPEAIIGTRRMLAQRSGHTLPPELPLPDWQAVLNRLLTDPEAPLP
jgi:hypothetical protein